MNVVCPGCGARFTPPETLMLASLKDPNTDELVPVQPVTMREDGTAFRALRDGEERHIDHRLRCERCRIHQR